MIKVDLTHIKPNLYLDIEGDDNTLFEISEGEAMEFGEAKIQLKEGCTYEYQFSDEKTKFTEGSKKNTIISSFSCKSVAKTIPLFV